MGLEFIYFDNYQWIKICLYIFDFIKIILYFCIENIHVNKNIFTHLSMFVVYAMISSPVPNAALIRHRVAKHKEYAKRKCGFV